MNEESLFHAALGFPGAANRDRFLNEACAGRPEMRVAVEKLLVAHLRSGAFLGDLAEDIARENSASADPPCRPANRVEAISTAANGGDTDWDRPSEEDAEIPHRLGRYQIRKVLGRGGMGSVYLAHDPELDRLVALKAPSLASLDAEERFIREARAAAAVSHPNLCRVFDVGRADGVLYLAMEYLPGPTLTDMLRNEGALPSYRAADIVARIARGMAEAHRHGVIHRDLKPGNILFNRQNEPVVADFGLALRCSTERPEPAQPMTAAFNPRLTQPGLVMGTPAYMPPEQIRGDQGQIGAASDIYSLGAILFELLTGRPSFEATSMEALAKQVVSAPAPAPSSIRAELPSGLDAICRRALAKDPTGRFPSMDAFAQSLAPFSIRRGQGSRWIIGVAAMAMLALFAAAIYLITDNGTIEIRLNDPKANVQVTIDGKEILITDGSRATRLRAGQHALEVTGPEFEAQTRLFKVIRGGRSILEVELKPKAAMADGSPADDMAPTSAVAKETRLAELLALGRQLIRQVSFAELGRVADDALEIDAESPGGLGLRATFRASRGEISGARADAEAALQLNPEAHLALMVRSHLNAQESRWDEGIADLTVAVRLDPMDAVAWANRASCYMSKGEYRQAIDDATRSIDLKFPRENALINRGASHACVGEYSEALEDYASAALMAPSSAKVFNQRSAVHAIKGDAESAAADWAMAVKLDPSLQAESKAIIPAPRTGSDDKAAHLARGTEKLRANDYVGAIADLTVAIRIDPADGNAYGQRSKAFAARGQHRQCLADLDAALQIAPDRAEWMAERGMCYLALGDDDQAIADFARAADSQPGNVAWRRYCAAIRARLGDAEGAKRERALAVQLDPTLAETSDIVLPAAVRAAKIDPVLPK